ncbi:MAG: bifunctional folylpolyglutamate synthase/dihydrofolate synthase [Sphingosinicella sp.]
MDRAVSSHPDVQAQLDRLTALGPGWDTLGLDRISRLLTKLGNPERKLPPVFHVAGTNGKGSTCAFLRAALEAAGHQVHVYTSPHLVRFNERIRLRGRLIEDEVLAALLKEVLDAAASQEISFFEATTAAAFRIFAETPADACIVEVGLGGRLDATNVIPCPLVCGIAQLGLDHQAFLGERIEQVAAEKAGIARAGVPLVTLAYALPAATAIATVADAVGAVWRPPGEAWAFELRGDRLHYRDNDGSLDLPRPALAGDHQAANAALAMAMLRSQQPLTIEPGAFETMMTNANWPARLQRLRPGPLTRLLPGGAELWLDGAHNPAAARAVAIFFRERTAAPFHIVFGLLANKDAQGVLAPFAELEPRIWAVPVPGHEHHSPEALAGTARSLGMEAESQADVTTALLAISANSKAVRPPTVLILGSLYLAGEVLRANDQPPV